MQNSSKSNNIALIVLVAMFFFWGYAAASNGVLIPRLKGHFELTQMQSQLVDFAFYLAYAVGSLIYFICSLVIGDPLNKIGYKNGLLLGLLVSAIGAFLFIPAVNTNVYSLFLVGLFVLAFGFAILQIVANPFLVNLGDPNKGSVRLNLAGSINSFGATIGPVILGKILFDSTHQSEEVVALASSVDSVKLPYILLGGLLLLMAIIIKFTPLPKIASAESVNKKLGAFKFPQLTWGMLAIFLYVGVEVTIGSNLGELAQSAQFGGASEGQIGTLVSLYWGSLMIGRWAGALDAFTITKQWRTVLQFIVPFIAFLVIIGINALNGHDVEDLWIYLVWIVAFLVVQYWSGPNPARTLKIFGIVASLFLVVSMLTSGTIALYSMICAGLFCSVLWPCIFNIAIKDLGDMTNQGSSLLILMILGGAIVPLIQGSIIDLGVMELAVGAVTYGQLSLVVGIVCFLYLSWYGHRFRRLVGN